MDLFRRARVVCLRSRYNTYLCAAEDRWNVGQESDRNSIGVRWTVLFLDPDISITAQCPTIQLISCYDRYLTANDQIFYQDFKHVFQKFPTTTEVASSLWQLSRWTDAGFRFKSQSGGYLWAFSTVAVVHCDNRQRSIGSDFSLWQVEVLEEYGELPRRMLPPGPEPDEGEEACRLPWPGWPDNTGIVPITFEGQGFLLIVPADYVPPPTPETSMHLKLVQNEATSSNPPPSEVLPSEEHPPETLELDSSPTRSSLPTWIVGLLNKCRGQLRDLKMIEELLPDKTRF